ncbi:hypothetical protein DM01DRAFT_1314495 [Hesseltinella vesiculosa]|uniref:Zn(2)-C6 fungal-type domain-containing protein n=1 Tax=Hesseltinella vesiculosa TaxID=101127 RepID=A0A1X2GXN5_9FUNG|nr:hypothetical protein DM01DRAFT_1314495 [Hesseltinella vesiculosa]
MSTSIKVQKTSVRKKKAARACIHCQKAHLTCDDSRPCQRCIKRGLSTTCTDGTRKKAKYLQDVDESKVLPPQPQSNYATETYTEPMDTMANHDQPSSNLLDDNSLLGFDYGFGSSAANLEYSILSNMLDGTQNPATPPSLTLQDSFTTNAAAMWATTTAVSSSSAPSTSAATASFMPPPSQPTPPTAAPLLPRPLAPQQPPSMPTASTPPTNENIAPNSIASSAIGSSQVSSSGMSTMSAYGDGAVVAKVASPITTSSGPSIKRRNQLVTPQMIYASVNSPFSYADGYHYLINYVRQNMGREELMRISRALALFRPSVLASMMNLTTDDLVFTEKCVQRTLLEYEKLITYSGTPTVVWRRTGEIALVGKEFSLLTQWPKDSLLRKKTFIYELMSNSSAIEYWEQYALHAFDNTDSAVYSSCILVSPAKRVVPCTFCFTIKRDIFDLPSVIVGNFLPILS